MLTDRYDLPLSTGSSAARDAYVRGCDLLLTAYPGALDALEQAVEADPAFALGHVALARARQLHGDNAGARAAMASAVLLAAGLPPREASHLAFFGLLLDGRTEEATAAFYAHLAEWPRDALVLSTGCTPSGLIGFSGRTGTKRAQVDLLDSLARAYGDDWWFDAHYAQALAETGQQAAARPRIERSMVRNPRNAWGAHWQAHVCYEDGSTATARDFVRSWLPDYPRDGLLHGHLAWHLALCEIAVGEMAEARRLFDDSIAPGRHSGPAQSMVADAVSFLWRTELAGGPRDPRQWIVVRDFVRRMFPQPGNSFADVHVALADAVTGDGAALEERVRAMRDLEREGRYPSGPVVPTLAGAFVAFQRGDYAGAIEALAPVLDQRERIGGSRAQTDLIEFTLLKAYAEAGRHEDLRRLLAERRPGPAPVPVAGL
jgi:tetratricopeptide (TPR) repeat protein